LATIFQLNLERAGKVVITIDPSHRPPLVPKDTELTIPATFASPSTYLAPADVSESEILRHTVLRYLLDSTLTQAQVDARLNATWHASLAGVYLWRFWQQRPPHPAWRKSLVKWAFARLDPAQAATTLLLGNNANRFCTLDQQWIASELTVEIPLTCTTPAPQQAVAAAGFATPKLAHLTATGAAPLPWYQSPHAALALAVAATTVADYVYQTYGEGKVTEIEAAFLKGEGWQTVAPQLLGISSARFAQAWRTYLWDAYQIGWKE
jgi:hypothetical protein